MKKIFTLAIAALAAMSVSAKEDIPLTDVAPAGDGVVTFDGSWQWKGITLSTANEDGTTTYADKSQFKYVVLEYSKGDCGTMNLIAQYEPDGTTGQWGANYYQSQTNQLAVNENGGIFAVALDEHADSINAIALQNGGTKGSITVTALYFASEEEYQAAKEAADKIEKTSEVKNDGTYTFAEGEKEWGWKGVWLDIDVTDFKTIVFEVASVTGNDAQITIQSNGTSDVEKAGAQVALPVSDSPKTYAVDISEWKNISQYAVQNSASPCEVKITRVYLTSKTKEEVEGKTDAINTVKAVKTFNANAPMYNLAGQQVTKSYKGVVIQNGRKFLNK